jgi:hypothetical protein
MNKKKLFLPIILIFIGLLTLIIIQSNKSNPDTSSELTQATPSPNGEAIIGISEGQTTKEEIVMLGDFEVSWSDPTEDGVWIYFDNDKGVRAAVIPVDNFDKLDGPQSYTYSLEEEYTVFAFFNQTLILKYMDKYMGVISLDLVGEGKDAQLSYHFQEL